MKYAGIQNVLLSEFPELQGRLRARFGSYYDLNNEAPAPYLVFEGVLKPVVLELLVRNPQDPFIPRAFAFFESMAVSQDIEVVNLLWIAILEPVVFDRDRLRSAWTMIGSRTQELAREVAKKKDWERNLPET